jgi:hypothetical protein
MKSIEALHPFFERVEFSDGECRVLLSGAFAVRGFRLAVVEPLSDLVEVAGDIGFRHEDGAVDWIRGCGDTMEQATVDALQHFLNLVVFPEDLSDKLVRRDAIA